ncbi:MAG: phosphatidate cytidylyltransferase [Pseudomonadota bacterium]
MLLPRVITALVLLPLLLAAIFGLGTAHLYLVFCVVGVLAAWEWCGFMGLVGTGPRIAYSVAMAAVLAAVWWLTLGAVHATVPALVSLLWWCVAFALVLRFPASFPKGPWSAARMAPLGLMLIAATLITVAALHRQPNGPWRLMFMLFIVFAADVGAYLVGRNYGRRKLAPAVSPGKSIEGAIGGLVLVALWAAAAGSYVFQIDSLSQLGLLVAVSVFTAAVSIIGDLTESLFKRLRGLKDSGTLLPGHGGFLDRIDSILAAAPVFYLGVTLLGI